MKNYIKLRCFQNESTILCRSSTLLLRTLGQYKKKKKGLSYTKKTTSLVTIIIYHTTYCLHIGIIFILRSTSVPVIRWEGVREKDPLHHLCFSIFIIPYILYLYIVYVNIRYINNNITFIYKKKNFLIPNIIN